jgi:hypothetical protein
MKRRVLEKGSTPSWQWPQVPRQRGCSAVRMRRNESWTKKLLVKQPPWHSQAWQNGSIFTTCFQGNCPLTSHCLLQLCFSHGILDDASSARSSWCWSLVWGLFPLRVMLSGSDSCPFLRCSYFFSSLCWPARLRALRYTIIASIWWHLCHCSLMNSLVFPWCPFADDALLSTMYFSIHEMKSRQNRDHTKKNHHFGLIFAT